MMSNIFGNAPKWEAVKVTDNSNILDNIAKAYTSQKSAFDDLQTAWRTFASDAQKAHQQESINALNNMSVDELTAVDAQTGQTAKEKFMADFAKRGEAIGGYNNQTAIDALYDQRINSAIADESAMRVRNEVVKKDEVTAALNQLNPLLQVSDNPNKVFDADAQKKSTEKLQKFINDLLDPNGTTPDHVKAAVIDTLNDNGLNRLTDKSNFLEKQATSDMAEYKTNGRPVFEDHLQNYAKAEALIEVAKATGDGRLLTQGTKLLASLKGMESVEDKAKGTVDGVYTLNYKKASEGVRRHLDANKTSLIKQYKEEYVKHYTKLAELGINVQRLALSKDAQKLDEYIAMNGSWAQQQQAALGQAELDMKRGTLISLTGNQVSEEIFKTLNISNPYTIDSQGNASINVDAVNTAVNNNIRKIMNPSLEEKKAELLNSASAMDRNWNVGDAKLAHIYDALDDYTYKYVENGRGMERKLTPVEKLEVAYHYSMSDNFGDSYRISPKDSDIQSIMRTIDINRINKITALLNDTLTAIATDGSITSEEVAYQLKWLEDPAISKHLDPALKNKLKTMYKQDPSKATFVQGGKNGNLDNARNRTSSDMRHEDSKNTKSHHGEVHPLSLHSKKQVNYGNTIYGWQ